MAFSITCILILLCAFLGLLWHHLFVASQGATELKALTTKLRTDLAGFRSQLDQVHGTISKVAEAAETEIRYTPTVHGMASADLKTIADEVRAQLSPFRAWLEKEAARGVHAVEDVVDPTAAAVDDLVDGATLAAALCASIAESFKPISATIGTVESSLEAGELRDRYRDATYATIDGPDTPYRVSSSGVVVDPDGSTPDPTPVLDGQHAAH